MSRRLLGVVVAVAVIALTGGAAGSAGTTQTYLIVYKQQAVPADAAASIQSAGGTLIYSYSQIGVAVATSGSSSFRSSLLMDNRVDNASSTAGFAYQLPADQ